MAQDIVINGVELDEASEMEGKFLTFSVGEEVFGIPIKDVVQIVGIQEITSVPEFPHYAKGIINLRGSVIPVIDIRLRLGKNERAYDERTCIIVTLIQGNPIGFIVDQVEQVTDISDENISDPPSLDGGTSDTYLTGVALHQGAIVLLLGIDMILSNRELNIVMDGKVGGIE